MKKIFLGIASPIIIGLSSVLAISCSDFTYDERDTDPMATTLQDLTKIIADITSGERDNVKVEIINLEGISKVYRIDSSNVVSREEEIKKFLGYGASDE